jgi:DcuC family C4-dicarboxylate transporter
MTPREVVGREMPFNLVACGAALAAFWASVVWWPEREEGGEPRASPGLCEGSDGEEPGTAESKVNVLRALVPLLPLMLLFLMPVLRRHWHLPELAGHVEIAAAMLVGAAAAALTAPRCANGLTAAFFEGAGYAYTHVVSFIIVATTFAAGVAATGLIERAARALSGAPAALTLASAGLPMSMAIVTGTGIGTGVPLIKILVPLADHAGADPLRIGALVAVFAQFGRTCSPVAPIVMLAATVTGVSPLRILRRVAPALLAGGAVLLAAVFLGWV